jgi:hypothetical protein
MAPHSTDRDWHCIAEQVSNEMDPAKLTLLIDQLCRALDRNRERQYPGE